MIDSAKKCRHPKCKCRTDGKESYCSKSCQEEPNSLTLCPCKHTGCYQECDLVMKGGITSGIVYPPLVLQLKEAYRFRCVGGSSAGAIAAAATAAAEYGRETGGFEKLSTLQEELGQGTFLRDLFQPSKKTRPLMKFLLDLLDICKSKRPYLSVRLVGGVVWALLRALPSTFGLEQSSALR